MLKHSTPAGSRKRGPGRSLHFSAAEEIGSRILRGDYAPGELLPNEAEWCKRLRMSRSAVREAMKMLMAKGLVTARPKVGTRVEPREHWNLLDRDVLVWYIAAPDRERFLRSVQEMRRIFEPEAAAMASLHRSAEQMAIIATACQNMGTATTVENRIEADVRFHLGILHAAGNEFLVPFGSLIESALATVFDFATRRAGTRHAQSLHEDIERAIRRQRPDAARRAVLRLLADTDEVITQASLAPRRSTLRQRRAAV